MRTFIFVLLWLLLFNPITGDREAGVPVIYRVTNTRTGQSTKALIQFFATGGALQAFDPCREETVRIRIPAFEKLEINGKDFTFTFPPIPPSKIPVVLKLTKVLLEYPLEVRDPAVCQNPPAVTFIRTDQKDPNWTIRGVDHQTPTEKYCPYLVGTLHQRMKSWHQPAPHLSEYVGQPIDWQDFRQVGCYCTQAIDPLCDQFPPARLLTRAVMIGDADLVSLLIERGAPLEPDSPRGPSALTIAVQEQNPGITRLLLKAGADTERELMWGRTVLMLAAREGNRDLSDLLVTHGAMVNVHDPKGRTPLSIAASQQHWDVAALLLESGADPNVMDPNQRTPLSYACEQGKEKMVRLMLEKGADADLGHGVAVKYALPHPPLLEILIQAGADVNAYHPDPVVTHNTHTPLTLAVQKGYERSVDLLLEAGADPDLENPRRDKPLYLAVVYRRRSIMEKLIQAGADVNGRLKDNSTPLTIAARAGYANIVECLLSRGADPHLRDAEGKTALEWARYCKRTAVIRVLENPDRR